MNSRTCRLLTLVLFVAACSDRPTAPDIVDFIEPRVATAVTVPPTANSPCNKRWATGVAGAWTDATKWTPAGVPTAASSVCIDAAGTYMVTLDPAVDATPVNVLALGVGGAGATPTLRLTGTGVILNIAQGIVVQPNATFDIRAFTSGVVTAAGTVTNQGTISSVASCGNCGTGNALNADIINQGTLFDPGFLTLGKVNGAYQNTGTIDLSTGGTLTIPASAGNPSFSQDAGVITGNGNFETIAMRAGTFTMNGGKARKRAAANAKPIVVLDGANLVIAPTASDSAALGLTASSTASRTVTGDIPLLTALWLAGPTDGQPGTITLAGNPTNTGRMLLVRQIDTFGGQLSIGGTGRLTNTGTIDGSLNSGGQAVFRFTLDVTNNGTMLMTSAFGTSFEKAGGSYINAGTIDMGPTSSVGVLSLTGSTLTNTGTVSGGTLRVDAGGRLLATGNSQTHIKSQNGGVIEPGTSPGTFTSYTFVPTTTGKLRIELGGDIVGTEYDQLNATQTAVLSGALEIVEANGFLAGRCGQVFDIVTHPRSSGAGAFGNVTGLNPGPGRMLRLMYINVSGPTGYVRLVGFDGAQKICVGPNPVSIAEGAPGKQYAVALDHAPTANVTVTPFPDAQVTVSPASLVFTSTNWQMPQFFTVTAVDDAVTEGAHTGTVGHAVATTDQTYQGFVPAALVANITDNDANLPPVVANDAATTAEDAPVMISVLGNDSDPEGKPLTVSGTGQPAHGSVQILSGNTTVRYTPTANYNGSDAFTYTASDGSGGTATATVNLTITPVPDAPTAGNDNATATTNVAVQINVLTNDADADGNPLTITQASTPAHGTAVINAGQSVTYRSAAGYVGPDAFTYTVNDGTGRTATATVSVTVVDPAAPPPPPPPQADYIATRLEIRDEQLPIRFGPATYPGYSHPTLLLYGLSWYFDAAVPFTTSATTTVKLPPGTVMIGVPFQAGYLDGPSKLKEQTGCTTTWVGGYATEYTCGPIPQLTVYLTYPNGVYIFVEKAGPRTMNFSFTVTPALLDPNLANNTLATAFQKP